MIKRNAENFVIALVSFVLLCGQAWGDDSIKMPDIDSIAGWGRSMVLDDDGFPVISYYDHSGNLKLLHCKDANCEDTSSIKTVDELDYANSVDRMDISTSLALDSNGIPVISYHGIKTKNGYSIDTLKIVRCGDENCSSNNKIMTLDEGGYHSSLVLDSDDFPVIAHRLPNIRVYDDGSAVMNSGFNHLRVVRCHSVDCSDVLVTTTTPLTISIPVPSSLFNFTNVTKTVVPATDINSSGKTIETLEPIGDKYLSNNTGISMVLDSNSFPVISYVSSVDLALRVIHCRDTRCKNYGTNIVNQSVRSSFDATGAYSSLVLDHNGYPVIGYYSDNGIFVKLLHCADEDCSKVNSIEVVEDMFVYPGKPNTGAQTSLVLDSNGFPVFSYYDYLSGVTKLLHCGDEHCSLEADNSINILDNTGRYGNSMVLDGNGFPVVSYYDEDAQRLKVLHCSDANCDSL